MPTLTLLELVTLWFREEGTLFHGHINVWDDPIPKKDWRYFSTLCSGETRYVLCWCSPTENKVQIFKWNVIANPSYQGIQRDSFPTILNAGDPQFFEKLKIALIESHNSLSSLKGCTICA